ncbi:hypothetical protein AN958_10637 [Leucoagaricus sp. SymC.cos]|nr:hypothetical protein AN958_10637 [Leucoagaricus sp. SymC.cos]
MQQLKPHVQLDGLIFMHNVCTNKISERVFLPQDRLMESLCGQDWQQKVIFLSSRWTHLSQRTSRENKEVEITTYWSQMHNQGASIARYEIPSLENAWKVLGPFALRALDGRQHRIREELSRHRESIKGDIYADTSGFVDRKTQFLRALIQGLGEGRARMTEEEQATYSGLSREGLLLWRKLESELDVREIEQWLGAEKSSHKHTSL